MNTYNSRQMCRLIMFLMTLSIFTWGYEVLLKVKMFTDYTLIPNIVALLFAILCAFSLILTIYLASQMGINQYIYEKRKKENES